MQQTTIQSMREALEAIAAMAKVKKEPGAAWELLALIHAIARTELDKRPTEPMSCPTPGACSCL